ncbi:sugar ABC transporter permease [Paenibacillus beijingensis]|uniref:Maltose/maltodextrin transport system permease protein n=2 Tax=Paenibacillus beijingensis TaxID=1126833 RepID=A0A0D5NQG4_9BACL|nr:sugar ABC transporter permease [Paenibacillus beijingensis]AJY77420.1 sugar ABC transporter permease [Paenibacillus beijingensis]
MTQARAHAKTAAILSVLGMGLGQFYNRQFVKGMLFLAAEIIYIYYLITSLASNFAGLITLGETPTKLQKVGKLYKNVAGDHSIFMMIYGLVALMFIGILAVLYVINVRDAYRTGKLRDEGKEAPGFTQTVRNLTQNSFPFLLLSLPALGVLFFTILPILFMVLMAFTNYSAPDHIPPKNLVDWVGLKTFKDLLFLKQWASTFVGVFTWTIIWAVLATVTCYFGGIFVALLIQQQGIRYKTFWRSVFIIPYAVPQFISFLVMKNLLNYQFGPVNQYFRFFGLQGLPWLNDPFWAKVTVILVNMWVGIPVSMVLVLGILTTIPKDLYEAAEVDGATDFQKFRSITLPYILFSTAPLLIMQFAGNINNFNVIFLLTNGLPAKGEYAYAGSTDLLVTWLYKLTLENQRYNFASAIGIILFIIIASFSLWNYRRTRSYREEDMIQ